MHPALYIEEILLNIFSFCYVPINRYGPKRPNAMRVSYANSYLAALARTCKSLKEPALNVLWAELDNLAPLVRCLPETSWVKLRREYSLSKRLGQSEWDIILCYASRVRALPRLQYHSMGLTAECIEELSKCPTSTTASILPNLRVVGLYGRGIAQLIAPFVRHLASSNLTKLTLSTENLGALIGAFGNRCPALVDLKVMRLPDAESDAISGLGLICHWQNLCSVHCYRVCLNLDALVHLSGSRSLTSLTFQVHDEVLDRLQSTQSFTPPLIFPALRTLDLNSRSLPLAQEMFCRLSVPAVRDLVTNIFSRPTSSDLVSFFDTLQRTRICDTLTSFTLLTFLQGEVPNIVSEIAFHHLQPLRAFVNIKSIYLDVPFALDLNEHQLLGLASSWPHLETFEVCRHHVWSTSSAITPGGFLQLLERCRSLRVLHFMLDTRGYTEIPQGHPWRGLTMPRDAFIHLLNSPIEEDSVKALGVFFHVAPYPHFGLDTYWTRPYSLYSGGQPGPPHELYRERWRAVFALARDLWVKRGELRRSLEIPCSTYR